MKAKKSVAPRARTVEQIADDLASAKRAESDANKARVALEEELIKALAFDLVEGSSTYEVGEYKVTLTAKLTRKPTDMSVFVDAVIANIPEALRPIKVKPEVDATGLKYLLNTEPGLFAKIAKYVVTEPAKTAVAISRKI
jgi:hypothetical protein